MDFSVLTDREREVLGLLSSGETNRRLARRLGIAERTVRAHTASIVRKLCLQSRFEAALVSALNAAELAREPADGSPHREALAAALAPAPAAHGMSAATASTSSIQVGCPPVPKAEARA
ncbi:response regulator transcription factor [Kitasatospora sp. NPDC101157]|uniref:response regulator transcription factor n=1 Tax=Kitasatospora sp. NPDC101157 TaxID=3364098 RepID=UPI003811363A